jgi:hypothetical protein
MSATELKSDLLRIINAINDNSTLKDIYSFISQKHSAILKNEKDKSIEQKDSLNQEKELWDNISSSALARAYSNKEPDYSNALIKEPNPEYKK